MKKRQILIELTSLLDVILILIFVLLMQAKTQTTDAAAAAEAAQEQARDLEVRLAAAETERDSALSERDALSRRILTDSLVLENSLVLTVSTAEDGTIRTEIDNGEARRIPYAWEDDTFARNSLHAVFLDTVASAAGRSVFVVFQYDRNRIYRTEYDMIVSLVQQMREDAKREGTPLNYIEADLTNQD